MRVVQRGIHQGKFIPLIPTPALPGSGSRVPGVCPISANHTVSTPCTFFIVQVNCKTTRLSCQAQRALRLPFGNLRTACLYLIFLRFAGFRVCGHWQGLSARPCILRTASLHLIFFVWLGIAPAGATKGLSARPLGTFGVAFVYGGLRARGIALGVQESRPPLPRIVLPVRIPVIHAVARPTILSLPSCDPSRAPPACPQATGENCCQC